MPDEALFTAIMSALDAAVKCWQSNGISMRYIPYPAKWLAGEHWANDIGAEAVNGQGVSSGNPKRNAFHNFTQRENSAEYYAEIERLERQNLLGILEES